MAISNRSFVFGVSVSDNNFIGRQQESRVLKMKFESKGRLFAMTSLIFARWFKMR